MASSVYLVRVQMKKTNIFQWPPIGLLLGHASNFAVPYICSVHVMVTEIKI